MDNFGIHDSVAGQSQQTYDRTHVSAAQFLIQRKRDAPVDIWVTMGLLNSKMSGTKRMLLWLLGRDKWEGLKQRTRKWAGEESRHPYVHYLDCGHSCTGVHTCQNLLNYTLHICTAYYMSILPQQGSSKFFLNVKKRSLLFVLVSNS